MSTGPEARLVELLEVVVVEGLGEVNSPKRRVTYYYRPDGTQVARRDQWEEEESGKAKPRANG